MTKERIEKIQRLRRQFSTYPDIQSALGECVDEIERLQLRLDKTPHEVRVFTPTDRMYLSQLLEPTIKLLRKRRSQYPYTKDTEVDAEISRLESIL
jgi:hypothetical protein